MTQISMQYAEAAQEALTLLLAQFACGGCCQQIASHAVCVMTYQQTPKRSHVGCKSVGSYVRHIAYQQSHFFSAYLQLSNWSVSSLLSEAVITRAFYDPLSRFSSSSVISVSATMVVAEHGTVQSRSVLASCCMRVAAMSCLAFHH